MKKFKEIDLKTWERSSHHEFFMNNFQFPHTTITSPIDVTELVRYCKERNFSLFHATVFLVSKTLNEIKEFRLRVRESSVIEWEKVNPSYTVLTSDKRFLFCDVPYEENLEPFLRSSKEISEQVKNCDFKTDLEKDDDRLFISCLPWIPFTQISHPIHSSKLDSVPRIAWGKISETREGFSMPLNIQAHHSFVDGYQLGMAFENFQRSVWQI